jgi:enoyl-CoA hydratase
MSTVLIEQVRPGVTLLTLNRPEKLNAMTSELISDLHAALDAVAADRDCRAVVLTGAGRGFCAGLDLGGYGIAPGAENLGRVQTGFGTQTHIAALVPHMRSLPQPVIAAVNGPAAGGGLALALASDIRIAAESARFNVAFVRIGLSGCDIGVSWMLPRLIGASRAWELMLTGRLADATEAERIGLVSRVLPAEELLPAALDLAGRIAANPPQSVRHIKEGLRRAVGRAYTELPEVSSFVANGLAHLFTTEDHKEAAAAFMEKRPAVFTGR